MSGLYEGMTLADEAFLRAQAAAEMADSVDEMDYALHSLPIQVHLAGYAPQVHAAVQRFADSWQSVRAQLLGQVDA